MEEIIPVLRSLGLLESEVHTYIAALELGPSTVIALSKKTQLSRQAIYDSLESLTKRKIMSFVLRGKKRLYAAEHPDTLMSYAKKRRAELEAEVKNLKRLVSRLELQMGGERPVVRMLEGVEGIKLLAETILHQKPESNVHEIADVEAIKSVFSEDELQLYRDAGKKRRLAYDSILRGESNAPQREGTIRRIVKEDDCEPFHTNIFVGEKEVCMISLSGKKYTIQIENKEIADAMKVLFSLAAEGLEKQD